MAKKNKKSNQKYWRNKIDTKAEDKVIINKLKSKIIENQNYNDIIQFDTSGSEKALIPKGFINKVEKPNSGRGHLEKLVKRKVNTILNPVIHKPKPIEEQDIWSNERNNKPSIKFPLIGITKLPHPGLSYNPDATDSRKLISHISNQNKSLLLERKAEEELNRIKQGTTEQIDYSSTSDSDSESNNYDEKTEVKRPDINKRLNTTERNKKVQRKINKVKSKKEKIKKINKIEINQIVSIRKFEKTQNKFKQINKEEKLIKLKEDLSQKKLLSLGVNFE